MKERTDWNEPKLLLVQGDFSGIQDFIFTTGGETQRRAAKLDFSLPESADSPLWNGYARRHINAFVPRFVEKNVWDAEKYQGIETAEEFERRPNEIKTP